MNNDGKKNLLRTVGGVGNVTLVKKTEYQAIIMGDSRAETGNQKLKNIIIYIIMDRK
ncbi:hypothetical protein Fmac_014739 [Flemingia macrophylla]|uniref:Uncharacterized protein n=1 Tax=Flemingia macrophylla TaxID=520843 RepID=A0ABD1MCL4_9FABA